MKSYHLADNNTYLVKTKIEKAFLVLTFLVRITPVSSSIWKKLIASFDALRCLIIEYLTGCSAGLPTASTALAVSFTTLLCNGASYGTET